MIVTQREIDAFTIYLEKEEKSTATIEKYLRDVRAFAVFTDGKPLSKEVTAAYELPPPKLVTSLRGGGFVRRLEFQFPPKALKH